MSNFSVFEYCYCDASNYKAFGRLLLNGIASDVEVNLLRRHMESGEFFIAEQLTIPPLYAELWKLSHGSTGDDHVWHTFENLRLAADDEINQTVFGTIENFVSNIVNVGAWQPKLSPHWGC